MIFKGKLAAEILSALYEQDELSVSELTKAVNGNWETVLRRIEELRAEGLIYIHKSEKFPFKCDMGLTHKGREIASVLLPKVGNTLGLGERMLLALLYGLGSELKGSTKLEKFAYRMQREVNIEKCFKFISYKYGPFSADVLKATQTLASIGLIQIEEKIWEVKGDAEKKIVTYRLTPRGRKVADDIFSRLPKDAREKILEFRLDSKKALETFLKEFYKKYPEFKKQTKLDAFKIKASKI